MGRECKCSTNYAGVHSSGTLHLDTDELRFRGEFRLRIPLTTSTALDVAGGTLVVTTSDGVAEFELGTHAERWAQAIRNQPTLLDKLDVRAGRRVAVLGLNDAAFLAALRERTPEAVLAGTLTPGTTYDLLFLPAEQSSNLQRIPTLIPHLAATGGLWVVAPKGQRTLTEMDVLTAGRAAGLQDSKVARFSATHTAHKFIIPKARR